MLKKDLFHNYFESNIRHLRFNEKKLVLLSKKNSVENPASIFAEKVFGKKVSIEKTREISVPGNFCSSKDEDEKTCWCNPNNVEIWLLSLSELGPRQGFRFRLRFDRRRGRSR